MKPSPTFQGPQTLSRRDLMRWGGVAGLMPAAWLLEGCAAAAPAAPAAAAATATTSADAAAATVTPVASAAWATGGTASIGGSVRALNPFLNAAATTCRLTCEATIGPCHTESPERVDISDGWSGLPMHLQLRIVDPQCQPIEGAIVEIWHTNHTGGYSGRIARMCNNDPADVERRFFRGWQRTGADGIARFDSCFPGWYGGRANHVHLRVLKGGYEASDGATAWVTSQLLFPDDLNAQIFGSEPLYKDKGQPDTTLGTDNVVGGEADPSPYLFDVQRVGGVMLASKTLAIRTRLDEAICRVQGRRGGPGGPGGPPPGGPGGPLRDGPGGRPGRPPGAEPQ